MRLVEHCACILEGDEVTKPCTAHSYPYVWRWRTVMPERCGRRCRIVEHRKGQKVVIEFEDGIQVLARRVALRKA